MVACKTTLATKQHNGPMQLSAATLYLGGSLGVLDVSADEAGLLVLVLGHGGGMWWCGSIFESLFKFVLDFIEINNSSWRCDDLK